MKSEAILTKIKELLEFKEVEREMMDISYKILKLLSLHAKVVEKRLEVENKFNEKRASLYQDYKINNPIDLKKGEIEMIMWEDEEYRRLYKALKELTEIEYLISVAIKEFERRGYALNNLYKAKKDLEV